MKKYTLDKAREYWRKAPYIVESEGYTSKELLTKSDDFIKSFVTGAIVYRDKKQEGMKYREKILKWIQNIKAKKMLDFGCKIGQDGVFFATNSKVEMTFADIVKDNADLCARYSNIWNMKSNSIFIDLDPKSFTFPEEYDIILANGVLHHSPEAKEIVANLKNYLRFGGLFTCMLYTKKHFKKSGAKNIEEYAKKSDRVIEGAENPYSDYYDEEKVRRLFEGFELVDKWKTHKGRFGWYVFMRQ